MNIFQVPQRRVRVRVLIDGGQRLEGVMYAPESSPAGSAGRLSDRLNDRKAPFVPVTCDEQSYLLNKRSVLVVELDVDEGAIEVPEGAGGSRPAVLLWMSDGVQLSGELPYEMPPERRRLLDYLNESPQFVPLVVDGQVLLINRERVCRVQGD